MEATAPRYAKGCTNGSSCDFCHFCDRGEKKRRQKALDSGLLFFVLNGSFKKIKGPNIETKIGRALIIKTPKKWSPKL